MAPHPSVCDKILKLMKYNDSGVSFYCGKLKNLKKSNKNTATESTVFECIFVRMTDVDSGAPHIFLRQNIEAHEIQRKFKI